MGLQTNNFESKEIKDCCKHCFYFFQNKSYDQSLQHTGVSSDCRTTRNSSVIVAVGAALPSSKKAGECSSGMVALLSYKRFLAPRSSSPHSSVIGTLDMVLRQDSEGSSKYLDLVIVLCCHIIP